METDMTSGRPLPIILKFTLPLLIGNIFQQLYNMADTIIVGQFVGSDALAAVGSTGTIMFLVLGFATGMSTGFTVLTSQKYGAKDYTATRISVSNAITLSAILVVLMTVISLLGMKPLLGMMNTPDDIFEQAYLYICIICAGTFASVYYNLFSAFLRAVGNSKMPLYILVFSACLNVALDLLFIVVFHLGVGGAAGATVVSQAISALLCLIYIYRKVPILSPRGTDWKFHRGFARHQLSIGLPMALQFGITASGTVIMQSAINIFGSTAVAAVTAASKVQGLVSQGMIAMGQTMASYAGQNYGKMDLKRIREGVRGALITDLIYSLICAVIVIAFLPGTLGIFFSEGENIAEMLPYARIYVTQCAIFYVPLSVIFVFRNTMQGCGYGMLPMLGGVVELVARLLCAALAIYLTNFHLAVGCDPFAWLCAGIYTGIAYLWVRKDIENKGFGRSA
ncbi:MAG: MATE family efflux transporter [Lachnospiraceae bacterium]|nr:MATE family efflux transporter [Lachnospiraceae bacterium]